MVRCSSFLLLLGLLAAVPSHAGHGIAAAQIRVFQRDLANTTNSVEATAFLSINDFRIRDGSNRGDYNIQIGESWSDDVNGGALMTCVAENGRDNGETSGTNYCTSAIDCTHPSGAFYVPVFNAPGGAEYNINVAAAWFPYNQWIAGYARNSGDTDGGLNNLLTASPGLSLGTHFIENGGGVFTVDLRSRGIDSRTDGVLLVTGGRNEDNYALSQANATNGTWTVWVKDNGTDAAAAEQDPVAFVFIPKTNTSVISGKFQGNGGILLHSGAGPQFNVTNLRAGVWRLGIPGQTPRSGVLIIAPEGGTGLSQDNIVSYQADGDGWLIESRDLPGNPPGLQTPTGPVASFVFIPAAAAELAAPLPDASNLGQSPLLKVAVSNAPGPVTMTFYGREAPTLNPGPDFTMVVLPDTQYYSAEANGGKKEMFIAQTEWAISNRISRNVAYVTHLGDISNSGDIKGSGANLTEWRNATNAMYRLENQTKTQLAEGIPYGLAVGNHDLEPIGDPTGTSIHYNRYFGIQHFQGRSYYGGHYRTNNNNHFDLFSASGLDFIVLYFEYYSGGDSGALAWAKQVLNTNLNRRIIAVTHYMGSARTPSTHSAQGAAIYNALRGYTNLFLLLGGHVSGEGSRTDTYNGRTIYTFIQDYQSRTNGGDGWMRTFEFSPSNNVVVAQTYNPWTQKYETDADSEMYFPYDMRIPGTGGSGGPFVALATNLNVGSGSLSMARWAGLGAGRTYEWYVVLTDADGNTVQSETWRFETTHNISPVINNQLASLPADTASQFQLIAFDSNKDPLNYYLKIPPQRGVILSWETNSGTVHYMPARGYRGSDPFTFYVSDGIATSITATVNMIIQPPADTNFNGLPDQWEMAYGISTPENDDDMDGHSNLQEYQAGTNPTNAVSVFKVLSAVKTPTNFTLGWSSVGGTRYRIQYRDGDSTGGVAGAFIDLPRAVASELETNAYGVSSTQIFTEVLPSTGESTHSRYYRVKTIY
jgi:hypothetical protein